MAAGVPSPGSGTAATSYEPEARALFARMTVSPASTRKAQVNRMILQLKSRGAWAHLKGFWMFAAHSQQAALLNWTGNAAFDAQLTGPPIFNVDSGFSSFTPTSSVSLPVAQADLAASGTYGQAMAAVMRNVNGPTLMQSTSGNVRHFYMASLGSTSGVRGSRCSFISQHGSAGGGFVVGELGPVDFYAASSGPFGTSGTAMLPGTWTGIRTPIDGDPADYKRLCAYAVTDDTITPGQFRNMLGLMDGYLANLGAMEV